MYCQKCNLREGKIHIINGNGEDRTEYILCDECAKSFENYDLETSFTDNDFLTSLIESIQSSPLKVNYIMTTNCKRCGMSYGNYRKLGRVGCSECYNSFLEKITTLIVNIQGSSVHSGKTPKNHLNYVNNKKVIKEFKNELNKEILKENFEEAAKIRDKIIFLEKNLGKGDANE